MMNFSRYTYGNCWNVDLYHMLNISDNHAHSVFPYLLQDIGNRIESCCISFGYHNHLL